MRASTAFVQVEWKAGGSPGVIVTPDGHVLMNCFPANANLSFYLPDGRRIRGSALGTSSEWNIGLAKLDGSGPWPHASLHDFNDPYGRVHLLAVDSGRRVALMQSHQSHFDSIAFSPDGRYLAGGNADVHIALWSLKLPDDPHPVVTSSPLGKHPQGISAVAFWPGSGRIVTESEAGCGSSDEPIVVSASGRQLRFWNAQTGTELESYQQQFDQRVRDMAWSPDGTLLVVCGDDFVSLRHGITNRDVNPGEEIRRIDHPADRNNSGLVASYRQFFVDAFIPGI